MTSCFRYQNNGFFLEHFTLTPQKICQEEVLCVLQITLIELHNIYHISGPAVSFIQHYDWTFSCDIVEDY
jgi:hypothetical protein